MLRLCRRRFPGAVIHWWIGHGLAPLLEGDPDLDGIIPFDKRDWTSPLRWRNALRTLRQARRERYDWVIDLQGLARSGFFAWLAHGRLTAGVEDLREGAAGFYDLRVPRRSFHTHAVEWYLDVLRILDVPIEWNFDWLPIRNDVNATVQRRWIQGHHPWIILNPGARWLNKRWPADYFSQTAQRLQADFPKARFIVLGGNEDVEAAEEISRRLGGASLNLAGRTSLLEMIELIRSAALMITNDTGPMHIAAAVGTPVAALFGPTEPRRTGPYGHLQSALRIPLPCSPCMKSRCRYEKPLECMRGLTPALVYSRIRQAADLALVTDRPIPKVVE